MSKALIKQAFIDCDHPFFKIIDYDETTSMTEVKVYSLRADYRNIIKFSWESFDELLHQVSLELIKVKMEEMKVEVLNAVKLQSDEYL
ncbi:hypothetical protein LCL95_07195 [Bacillus timonensis]|nr:hypothetical protein [Bacillus timonensis]